ncbi:GDA family protein [Megaselia abdita]
MKAFVGKIVHTKSLNEFVVLPNGYILVDDNGKITEVGENYVKGNNVELVQLNDGQFLMPGFIDSHIHAPQFAQNGLGLDMELLDWLNNYTFPLESKFADKDFASKIYKNVVKTTLALGTTMASYFGTNHRESTLVLAETAVAHGQRALVGKVCSCRNCPDFYVETEEESVRETKLYLQQFESQIKSPLVKPIITPRFAISCTETLLKSLGDIAKSRNYHIQSHISENLGEIEFTKSLYGGKSYANIYNDAGLLTNKTVMAHGVFLEDEEVKLFAKTGTSVSHCPASNTMLSSGLCDVLRLLKNGVTVGLGTDVSGGNCVSIKDVILRALDVSHHLEFIKKQEIKGTGKISTTQDDYVPLNYKQAIYLATLGGASALSVDNVVGNFEVGKEFDALLIDTSLFPMPNFVLSEMIGQNFSPEEKVLELVQKFIFNGDDRNILKIFVAGKQVK